jgi:hypothetical protein
MRKYTTGLGISRTRINVVARILHTDEAQKENRGADKKSMKSAEKEENIRECIMAGKSL